MTRFGDPPVVMRGGIVLLVLLLAGSAAADTVKLKSGQVIKGKVQDRGAYVIVEKDFAAGAGGPHGVSGTALASVRIERAEIATIEIEGQAPVAAGAAPAPAPKDLDVVVFVNGDELPGHVEIRGEGKEVVIVGEGDRGEMALDSRQVRTILWSQRAQQEQRAGGTSVGATVKTLLDELKSQDEPTRKTARAKLDALGVYALPYLETRAADPAADPLVRDAVSAVIEVARLKTYMTPALAERVPGLARALVEGDEKERLAALKEAVVAGPKDCVPILVHLAKRERSKDVRAFVLAQLSLMDRVQELLELLEARDGGLRFAAAIALGDNGVFVGVPLLIEALKHDEVAIRKLAVQKLEAWTGQFLGYFADGEPEKRAAAIGKWEEWWAKDGKTLTEKSLRATVRKAEVTEDEKTEGLAHWTNAELLWEKVVTSGIEGDARRRELYKVRFLLEKSLERYPQNPNARIAKAVLSYTELDDVDDARRELDLVLHRYADDAADASRLHAHFHLGRIAGLAKRWDEAEKHYRLALTIDPKNVDALRAVATLAYDRALGDERLDKDGRRRWVEESAKQLGTALAALDQYELELRENAEKAADAVATAQPFRRGTFLKSVDAVKLELRRTAADLHFLRGRSYAALQQNEKAYADYAAALELDPENPLYKGAVKAWTPPPGQAPPSPPK